MDKISGSPVDNGDQTSQTAYNALVSEVTAFDVAKSAKLYFSKFDTNNDGALSELEISAGAKDNSINSIDQRLIGTLAGRVASVEKMSSGRFFADTRGITYEDLNVLGRLASERHIKPRSMSSRPITSSESETINEIDAALATRSVRSPEVFGALMKRSFSAIDVDKTNSITRLELDDYIQKGTASDDQKEVAKMMLWHFDDFKSLSSYGIDGTGDGDPPDAISYPDVRTFNEYMIDAANFEAQLKSFRREEYWHSALVLPISVAGAVGMGAFAILNPEPVTKIIAGADAIGFGVGAGIELHRLFIGKTGNYREEFESRQRMLNSWKYFQ